LEGLIFGGAYLWREICVSKSIGLASQLEVNLPFLLCFTLYVRAISASTTPQGAYIWRDDLTEGFFRHEFRGLIFGGAYTWRGLLSEFYSSYITITVLYYYFFVLAKSYLISPVGIQCVKKKALFLP